MADVKTPRPYTSAVRDEQARRTRARIVRAADELFRERGYAKATMKEIAERAGILYRVSRWSDAAAIHKQIVVDDPASPGPVAFVERVTKLAARDFARLFARAGLVVEAVFGDYALGAFEPAVSPRLILVARKGDGRADRLAA